MQLVNLRARARESEGEKRRGLSAHSPSPRARHPNPRSWLHERPRRSLGCDGEKLKIPSHKPRVEGYEMEILANIAFRGPVNHVTCMRKPQALNALTVWVFARDERATKATAQAIGWAMSSLVVLERHLWLTMMEMKEAGKVPFLDAPVLSSSLFGPAVKGFAECFTEAQNSSQAMQHFFPKRASYSAASRCPKPAPTQQPAKPTPATPEP